MDIKLKKRPWYFRHKYYIILGAALIVLIVYNIIVMAGPTTVSADAEELKIAVVMNGRITERGTHEELMSADGTYKSLYSLQFRDNDLFE